jgi:protein-S-isoprenylcysteine O-methyltransferase Ste14
MPLEDDMALAEEMEAAGNWLFSRRSYVPVLMIGVFLAGMADFRYPGDSPALHRAWGLVCAGVSLAGLAVRAVAVGHAPGRTSGKNTRRQVAAVLNRTGMYSVTRHPLYLGNFLISMGIALFERSWWVALVTALLFILYYERIMFAEEAFLRREFGADYAAWADRTPPFVPNPRLWQRPSLPFSFRTVLRREYGALFATVACFAFLDVLANTVARGSARLDPLWQGIAAFAAALYLAVRALAKFTSVLSVEGR